MAETPEYEIRKLNKDFTMNVKIKVTREFKVRVWIAVRLMLLAAWVLGCDADFVGMDR